MEATGGPGLEDVVQEGSRLLRGSGPCWYPASQAGGSDQSRVGSQDQALGPTQEPQRQDGKEEAEAHQRPNHQAGPWAQRVCKATALRQSCSLATSSVCTFLFLRPPSWSAGLLTAPRLWGPGSPYFQ